MSAPRFYCPPPISPTSFFELPPEAAHHAQRVLRLRPKDAVQVFDGEGRAFDATIAEMSGKRIVLENLRPCPDEPVPPLRIILAQAMCSSEKMDWIVQKAVELGAASIRPVQTRRSVAKLTHERAEKRLEHWRSVIIAACEQCGRNTLPEVHAPQEFGAWLLQTRAAPGTKFILQPQNAVPWHQHPRPPGDVTLLIGPEGGFEQDEIEMAQHQGFLPVLLGPRVLRTETAALAGIAVLQALWGDLS
jgi:16S rRNA (uracil1498-N3)-methyltransferase